MSVNNEMAQQANLAARLLTSGGLLTDRREDIVAAVRTARILIDEVQKHPQIHASDLFEPHQVLSVKDIAKTFSEHGWPSLSSEASVKKRAIEILTALQRDIQRRSNLLSSAFQLIRRNINPEDAEREATRQIRELLERLGMSSAFGEGITQAVSNTWQKLLEEWLWRVWSVREQMERSRNHTPEHFEQVCPDLNYSEFCASQRPWEKLCSDELLNLGLQINRDLRKRLEDRASVTLEELDRLETLNRWPEWLFPDEPHLARPFAAFLATIKVGDASTQDDLENFDLGLRRLSLLISRVRIKELSERIRQPWVIQAPRKGSAAKRAKFAAENEEQGSPVDPLVQLQEIRAKWWTLQDKERASAEEAFIDDPVVMMDAALAFVAEGRFVSGRSSLPFHGGDVRDPLMRTYASNLDSLYLCLKQLERLWDYLGFGDMGLMLVTQSIHEEIKKFKELATCLQNAGNSTSKKRLGEGKRLLEKMDFRAPSPGRMRPCLLFAYARESQSLEDPKLKDLLCRRAAT